MNFGKVLHNNIFAQELTTVRIAGEDVPVKFGISALAEVEEIYGTLEEYERRLKGLKKGKEKKSGDAGPVRDGLLAMVHCGCRLKGYDLVGVTDEEIISGVEMPYPALRALIVQEFNRNFVEPDETEKK